MVLSDLINFATYYYKKATKYNAMCAAVKLKHILHDLLKKQCPKIHQKRLNSLMVATESLLDGNQLSLTQLGRNITGSVAAKHNIKRIDRLLGNHHLVQDKITIYQWHARYLCASNPMPIILVDWSDVREQLRMMTLRASISVQGRSVTLYERTFLFGAQHFEIATHLAAIMHFSLNLPAFYLKVVVHS